MNIPWVRRDLVPEAYEQRPYFKRLIMGARQELKYSLLARKDKPVQKFMIFAQGRTGSTLLTSTLDLHPDIRCDDEILITPRAFPRRFVEIASRQAQAHAYGFHVKIYQLIAWQRIKDIAAFLKDMEDGGWQIIYLSRENILRHVVSNIFAEAAGAFHMSGAETRPTSVALSLERLEYEMQLRTNLREAERVALQGRRSFNIVYERDLQSPERQRDTFSKLQEIIGVTNVPLEPRLKKMVISPLSELLSNYDEVARWVAERPNYARYLET